MRAGRRVLLKQEARRDAKTKRVLAFNRVS